MNSFFKKAIAEMSKLGIALNKKHDDIRVIVHPERWERYKRKKKMFLKHKRIRKKFWIKKSLGII